MTETVLSKDSIIIRLTDERWDHITDGHNELADMRLEVLETIVDPPLIQSGKSNQVNFW